MPIFDVNKTRQLIEQRRSIKPKNFSTKKVDKSIIDELLNAANWAPTHAFTEPWRFDVFTGDALQELAAFQSELYKKLSTTDQYKEDKYLKLQKTPLLASHVISIGMKRQECKRLPEFEELAAVACAVQNMHLMATAHGLAAYWTSGGVTNYPEAKAFFNLEEDDQLLGFFYIGYPEGEWPTGKRKSSIDKKVNWR